MPPIPELPNLELEGAEYMFRPNFEGRKERYNKEGNRYFNVKIPMEYAESLQRDGWNIKWSKPSAAHPNPEEHVSEPYLEVTVGFEFRPPTIILIKDNRPVPVTETTVKLLESTEFKNIDMVIRARYYDIDGSTGYKAYLKEFYGTVEMSDLARKYAFLDGGSDEPSSELSAEDD